MKRTLPRPARAALIGLGGALLPLLAAAAEDVPAEGPLPALAAQRAVARPAGSSATFELKGVYYTGVTVFDNATLAGITALYSKRQTSFQDLQKLADRVTALYHENGYFLAKAVVPAQEVRDGMVEISVIEGKLGTVQVRANGKLPVSDERVAKMLAPVQPGKPVNNADYERAMLLLSDTPGLKVQSALSEGTSPGTTDLEVQLDRKRPWVVSVDADNNGTRSSGRERFGVTARWLSPLGIGDNLDGRFLISSNDSVALGRLSYEAPVGYDGWRAGGGYSHVRYELGGVFSVLGAQGTADIGDVFLSYPLIRSRDTNAYFRVTGEYKALKDELDAVGLTAKKNTVGGSIGTVYESRDGFLGGGYVSESLTVYHGNLKIRDDVSRFLDSSIFGHDTEGAFTKFTFQLSRLQALFARNSLYVAVAGQFAGENLDSSEKLNLGGAGAVRAFPNGEMLADDGFSATAEWRIGLLDEVTLSPFYDYGRGRIFHEKNLFDGDLWRTLSGPGVGLTWARAGNFTVLSTVAWRDRGEQFTEGNKTQPRWFWQVQKSF